jgi:hypothetical protein
VRGFFYFENYSTKSRRDPVHKVKKELLLWLPC